MHREVEDRDHLWQPSLTCCCGAVQNVSRHPQTLLTLDCHSEGHMVPYMLTDSYEKVFFPKYFKSN